SRPARRDVSLFAPAAPCPAASLRCQLRTFRLSASRRYLAAGAGGLRCGACPRSAGAGGGGTGSPPAASGSDSAPAAAESRGRRSRCSTLARACSGEGRPGSVEREGRGARDGLSLGEDEAAAARRVALGPLLERRRLRRP